MHARPRPGCLQPLPPRPAAHRHKGGRASGTVRMRSTSRSLASSSALAMGRIPSDSRSSPSTRTSAWLQGQGRLQLRPGTSAGGKGGGRGTAATKGSPHIIQPQACHPSHTAVPKAVQFHSKGAGVWPRTPPHQGTHVMSSFRRGRAGSSRVRGAAAQGTKAGLPLATSSLVVGAAKAARQQGACMGGWGQVWTDPARRARLLQLAVQLWTRHAAQPLAPLAALAGASPSRRGPHLSGVPMPGSQAERPGSSCAGQRDHVRAPPGAPAPSMCHQNHNVKQGQVIESTNLDDDPPRCAFPGVAWICRGGMRDLATPSSRRSKLEARGRGGSMRSICASESLHSPHAWRSWRTKSA